MILANELRIGNWVQRDNIVFDYKGGCENNPVLIQVSIDNLKEVCSSEYYTHILLSHEILEKCGFTRIAFTDYGHQQLKGFCFQIINGNVEIIARGLEFCDFKYLHQLQNLYFALTGTELEVNL